MNLSTSMLGLPLSHPFVAGASPLGRHLDDVRRLEDGGAAAIVLPSLFEEQITLASEGRIRHKDVYDRDAAVDLKVFPRDTDYAFTPDEYAEHVARVRQAVRIPVIGSLNGTTSESWLRFARLIEQAGAQALELNLFEVVADAKLSGAAVEHQLVQLTAELRELLHIPIAIKISPFFASIANVVHRLDEAGAAGVVIFNRFYEPDIDVDTMRTIIEPRLSTSDDLLLRLHWLGILYGRVRLSLIACGGIADVDDGIKALLAGANAVQIVSASLRHGPRFFDTMRRGLQAWMERKQLASMDAVRGRLSLHAVADPSAFERANYLRTLHGWKPGS
ncbi:MAG TPA: dihydroorotate dehydrogenase-like protein [Vicinamibacterales bacterium]|nr:dihydroorotate dehydrogenase-like protein [Vicinamibacterales bacterium]